MIQRYEVAGAGGVRLAAWDFAVQRGVAGGAAAPGPAGGRPGVLLLHGLLGRASHWAPTARRLAPRYRALALDQRGHGRSDKPGGPYTLDAYAADAIATVEQLGLAPVTLIGHAMGALTAWQCAARRPDLVAAVVICDMRASPLGEARQQEWTDWLRSWPVPFATLADVRRWFATAGSRLDVPDPVRGDYFAEVMEEREDGWWPHYTPAHLLSSREPWMRDAHWEELARVSCPTLVVRGLDGQLGRAEAQEMVRVLPHGRYAEIPDAGPLVPWEQPESWGTTVEEFLAEVVGSAGVLQGSEGAA